MRVRLLSFFVALALIPVAAPAQEAPADEAAQDAAPASDDPDAVKTTAAKVPLDEIRRYVTS